MADAPVSYRDPLYASLDAKVEQKLGLPAGLQAAIREHGERTNADKVSSAGAKTVYQITPATRDLVLKKYGIDPYLSTENAAEVAGLLLKEGLDRNKGDVEAAVREYHGGTDKKNWGPINNAYAGRVMSGMSAGQDDALLGDLRSFVANKKAAPAAAPVTDDGLISELKAWKKQGGIVRSDTDKTVARIPGMEPGFDPAAQPQAPDPSVLDRVIGAGETAATLVTGATGGTLGMLGGAAGGLAGSVMSGDFGTAQGADQIEQAAMQGAQALTYAPRTPAGQSMAQTTGDALANLIPLAPLGAEAALLRGAAAPARQAVGDAAGAARASVAPAVARVQQAVAPAVERVRAAMPGGEGQAPTPGTLGSVGAAGTDMALQRQAAAADLPVPIPLTRGQATRDFEQLRFEQETAKNPRVGAPLREFAAEQNAQIPRNFDAFVDMTGAEAQTLIETGRAVVDKALVKQAARDKAEIRVAYKNAEKAGELEAPVSLDSVVGHLNESAPDAATAPLLNVARARAISLGLAKEDADGALVPQPVTLKTAETYRQAINRATGYEPTNVRQASIIKGLVDESTEGVGGDLYKAARGLRARYAQKYENRAIVSDLLATRKGTSDRRVALEDVFKKTILSGSREDLSYLRNVLQSGGPEGKQAWAELQGATVRYIRDEAMGNTATDIRGNTILSAAKLDRAIKSLDSDGKLEFVFTKRGAQQMRDLSDLAKHVYTQPPGAVNTSNTASVLLQAITEAGITGSMTGLPVPVLSGLRALTAFSKDRKLRARVNEAIGKKAEPLPQKARTPAKAPASVTRNMH